MEKNPHLVNWAIVCLNRKVGGLGIKWLLVLNKALFCANEFGACYGKGLAVEKAFLGICGVGSWP